jgi:hypothetical protein
MESGISGVPFKPCNLRTAGSGKLPVDPNFDITTPQLPESMLCDLS